jgi:glycerol-3-phosphate dehydrogenase
MPVEERGPRYCVLGAGHGGLAMAGHLALMGFEVNLYNRTEERLWPVQQRGGIEVTGEIEGFGRVGGATSNIEEAIADVDIPMSLVPMASLGEMLGVPTPTIKSLIHLASVIHGRDYWAEGRTAERLERLGRG